MTDHDGTAHRSLHDPKAGEVSLREPEEMESGDGMMEIRLPIASSGEVRNEGDEPLSGAELRGMASQVDDLTRGVFPEHGNSDAVDGSKYSQFEKLGYWAESDLQREASADGEDLLMATARMPDPETLPAATGDYRESLAILKEQAKRGIPISASIGWRDDEDAPGGVDLMEASIVGIGADSRTTTEGGTEALARAAVDAGADPEAFVARVAELVAPDADADTDQEHDMTDNDPPADEEGTTDDAQDGDTEREMDDAEYREFMREQQEQQTELLRTLADVLREDKEDDEEDDDEDEDEDEDDEGEMNTSDADDADGEQSADDDLNQRMDKLEAELEEVRSPDGDAEVDTPDAPDVDADAERDADAETDGAETDDSREAEDPTMGLGDYR